MTTEPSDLSTLVAALRAGDPSALQALYELYAAPLVRFSAFRLGDAEAAQDVVQEVFIQVWQHARTFEDRGEAALVAWLYTIANHVVINHLRRRRRRPSVSLDATGDGAPLQGMDLAHTVCEREALRAALAQLSPLQQQVIALRFTARADHRRNGGGAGAAGRGDQGAAASRAAAPPPAVDRRARPRGAAAAGRAACLVCVSPAARAAGGTSVLTRGACLLEPRVPVRRDARVAPSAAAAPESSGRRDPRWRSQSLASSAARAAPAPSRARRRR